MPTSPTPGHFCQKQVHIILTKQHGRVFMQRFPTKPKETP